jgi:hypothetical protein
LRMQNMGGSFLTGMCAAWAGSRGGGPSRLKVASRLHTRVTTAEPDLPAASPRCKPRSSGAPAREAVGSAAARQGVHATAMSAGASAWWANGDGSGARAE